MGMSLARMPSQRLRDRGVAGALAAASAGKRRTRRRRQHASRRDHRSSPPRPPIRRGAGRIILALVLGFAAIGLAVVGLTVNTRFAASFGQTAEAAMLLAAIGLTIDLLAIALPSAARAALARPQHHGGRRPPGRSG